MPFLGQKTYFPQKLVLPQPNLRKIGAAALPTFKYCSESKLYKNKVVALGEFCVNLKFRACRLAGI